MDIKSGQLSTLLLDVEKVRRRKVVDYKSEQDIKYIDLADNAKWVLLMRKRRRKTLVVCPECHKLIHS